MLTQLIRLFGVQHLRTNPKGLYETGFFTAGASNLVEKSFKQLLIDLRPHMLGLVEWFSVGDTIPSVIGNKYGDIYEAQLEAAVNSRLNKQPVPSFYDKYMKPTMTMYKAKL